MNSTAQKYQDMICIVQQQRDQCLNALTQVQADLMAARRRIAELEVEIAKANSMCVEQSA